MREERGSKWARVKEQEKKMTSKRTHQTNHTWKNKRAQPADVCYHHFNSKLVCRTHTRTRTHTSRRSFHFSFSFSHSVTPIDNGFRVYMRINIMGMDII